MRKFLVVLIMTLAVSPFSSTTYADGTCGPYQQSAAGSPCHEPYIGGELMRLADGVASGWVRSSPSSSAPVLAVVRATSYPNLEIVWAGSAAISSWDGTQRWYKVHLYPLGWETVGWIEQASLVSVVAYGYPPEDPISRAGWALNQQMMIKPGFTYLWMRRDPSSSGQVVATLYPDDRVTLPGPSSFDGAQWWWQVSHDQVTGWVEQAGIVVAPAAVTNRTPQITGYAPADPTTLALWYAPQQVMVKPGVPFLWLRADPSSAGRILVTALPTQRLTLSGRSTFDGVQWWWEVSDGHTYGWVEQVQLVTIQ
jgi:hypothetical protein